MPTMAPVVEALAMKQKQLLWAQEKLDKAHRKLARYYELAKEVHGTASRAHVKNMFVSHVYHLKPVDKIMDGLQEAIEAHRAVTNAYNKIKRAHKKKERARQRVDDLQHDYEWLHLIRQQVETLRSARPTPHIRNAPSTIKLLGGLHRLSEGEIGPREQRLRHLSPSEESE